MDYNPAMAWSILGHAWAIDLLRRHIRAGGVRHAYLFTGPDQVGKRTLAVAFAQALTCPEAPEPGEACGRCRTCETMRAGTHPDLSIVRLVAGRQRDQDRPGAGAAATAGAHAAAGRAAHRPAGGLRCGERVGTERPAQDARGAGREGGPAAHGRIERRAAAHAALALRGAQPAAGQSGGDRAGPQGRRRTGRAGAAAGGTLGWQAGAGPGAAVRPGAAGPADRGAGRDGQDC